LKSISHIYSNALLASIEASSAIMEVYKDHIEAIIKDDGSPVTKADFNASEIINRHLSKSNIPIIGEELTEESFDIRSQWTENWCVDPLDGTRMFLKRNDEFSVNIAHIKNKKPVFGLIASPVNEEILFGGPGIGVFITSFKDYNNPSNWREIEGVHFLNNPLTLTCSRSYQHGSGFNYIQILEKQFGELEYLRMGSALKFFELAKGNADLYPRFAPTMEWDIASGHAILKALGGDIVSVSNNKSLEYNKKSLFNEPFIAKSRAFLKI
jgi:3'(2'), 5'-bisphosphate nucleotidase